MNIDFLTGFAHELGAAKAAERAEVRKREDAELERRRGILDDLWKGVTEGRVNPRFYAQAVKDSLSIGDAQVKGGKRGKRQDPLTPFLDMLTSMPEEPQAAAAPAQGAQGAGPFNPPRFINPNELFITQPPETKAQMLSRATTVYDRLPADYDVRQSPDTERLLRESGLPLVERTVGARSAQMTDADMILPAPLGQPPINTGRAFDIGSPGERRLTRPETAEESRVRETRDAMVQQLTTILRRPDLPTEDRAVLSAELARVRAGGPLPSMEQLRLTLEPKRAPAASASDLDWADRATAALNREITPEMRGTLSPADRRAVDQYERSMRGVERPPAITLSSGMTPQQITTARQLRTSLRSEPSYQALANAQEAITAAVRALDAESGPGDIMAINLIQRGMVDPGVAVREGDVALLQRASPLLAKIFSEYPIQRLRDGAILPPEARAELRRVAAMVTRDKMEAFERGISPVYQRQAEAAGIPFDMVFEGLEGARSRMSSLGLSEEPQPSSSRPASQGEQRKFTVNGKEVVATWNGKAWVY